MDISEKSFEQTIEDTLIFSLPAKEGSIADSTPNFTNFTPGGYHKRKPEHYDRHLCLDSNTVLDFIYATQPEEWKKLKNQYKKEVKDRFFRRLFAEITRRGTLDVLRKGIKDSGCKFQLAYFKPVSHLNPEIQKLYEANIFTVIRQLKYSEKTEHSLDMVLFLNGLPVFTTELKNPLTGQNVQNAINQYMFDRNPREPLFAFGRCLAHFAIDPDLVYMTTHLKGPKTRFLPFNQGNNNGAGNPPSWQGYATAYLWEHVWAKDSVLNLIRHFIHIVEEEDDRGRKTGERSLIFPRYHQLDSVRRLVASAFASGPGQRYLIQHSAGSGKSNSIAWLAHQLSVLHDPVDKRIFDSIIIITDRRVLDKQLQHTVRQFEQTLGVVENIEKTSRQLKEALESGKTIIVTTLQKFPVIVEEIDALPGKTFAVIVDEAHSSQSGESTKKLKSVLSVESLEDAEKKESGEMEDMEDKLVEEAKKREHPPNVSTFAFTATPKPKTLELFGIERNDGKFEPFSLYSMRQAIEEKFILDVLENYTTFKAYWSILKKIEDDPRYDRTKATYLLKSFVDLHEHTITKKVAIMVEHFSAQVAHRIDGKAKAMIVTRSRLHAVRYKLAVDRYLKEKGYPYQTLVAFSDSVDDKGNIYSESNMNGFPETQTAETFKQKEYRFLIVANKFQTGFDQPLLHTMYVDKKLGGVHAVQTLSRLNRIYQGKEETMVLDFANEAEDIQKAFEPYYEKTLLKESTDPNILYDLSNQLEDLNLYSRDELDNFIKIYFNPKATQDKIYAALSPVVDRFNEVEKEEQVDFRHYLNNYIRLYAFLSQVITFIDADLEKLYLFARLLIRYLCISREELPKEIQQNIDMDSYRLQKTGNGMIKLERGKSDIEPIGPKGGHSTTLEELEPLSQIIEELNELFGTEFTGEDKVFIMQLEEKLIGDPALEASVRVNPPENARLTFDHVVNDRLQEMIDSNFKFYKQITDDQDFGKFLLDWLFERYTNSMDVGKE
jgi:type I restriction enzyme R subunit